jgi:hypothetical protein
MWQKLRAVALFHMVQVSVKYTGDLHCDATHGPRKQKFPPMRRVIIKAKAKPFRLRIWSLRLSRHASAPPWELRPRTSELICAAWLCPCKRKCRTIRRAGSLLCLQKFTSPRARSSAAGSPWANRAQLSRPQKPPGGNSSPDQIFLGRMSL